MKDNRGFTIIEIMVVVGIIGLLAALTIAGINTFTRRAQASTLLGELVQEINNAKMNAAQHGDPILIVLYDDTNPAKKDETGFYTFRERKGSVDLPNLTWNATAPHVPIIGTPPIDIRKLNFRPIVRSVLAPAMPSNAKDFTSVFPFKALFTNLNTSDPVCTFCVKLGSTAHLGAIRVFPDGHIALSKNKDQEGGGVLFVQADPNLPTVSALAILAPSGMARIF